MTPSGTRSRRQLFGRRALPRRRSLARPEPESQTRSPDWQNQNPNRRSDAQLGLTRRLGLSAPIVTSAPALTLVLYRMLVNENPGVPGTAAKLPNRPGSQKLTPRQMMPAASKH